MNNTYKAVVIVINASGDSDAITIDVPDTFEKCSAEERDYIEGLVEDQGYDFLTYFSTESELDVLSYALNDAKPQSIRTVKHWNHAEMPADIPKYQMDVNDQRQTSGQLYVDLGPLDGNIDDCLSVSVEVTMLRNGTHTQAINIALNNGDNMLTLLKQGENLIVQPEGYLRLEEISRDKLGVSTYVMKVE